MSSRWLPSSKTQLDTTIDPARITIPTGGRRTPETWIFERRLRMVHAQLTFGPIQRINSPLRYLLVNVDQQSLLCGSCVKPISPYRLYPAFRHRALLYSKPYLRLFVL